MKSAITPTYTFVPASKTINLSGIASFSVDKLYAIVNVTANQLIYAVGQPKFGFVSVAGTTVTLVYNTASMNAADNLMILYDTSVTYLADGAGNLITSTSNALDVNLKTSSITLPVSGTFWQTTQPVSIASMPITPVTGTFWQATQPVSGTVAATQSGTWNITNVSGTVSLPTGASTSALQTTGNTSLSSIDTKTPALGQALMAASSPVTIASNQSAIPVSGTFWQATQPVSGTVSANATLSAETTKIIGTVNVAASQTIAVTQATGTNLHTIVDSGSVTATISGTPNVAVTSSTLPTGAATSALQTTGNASLVTIASLAGSTATPSTSVVTVQGASGSVAIPVSLSSTPLPAGAATETTLASINTKTPALGQTTMSASQPVVIASNQSAIPISTPDSAATGSLTAVSQTVVLPLAGYAGCTVSVQGTWAGTLNFEVSVDSGTTWFPADVFSDASNGEIVQTQITAPGVVDGNFTFTNLVGQYACRVIVSAYTSGTIIVNMRANSIAFSYPTYISDNAGNLTSYGTMIAGTDGTATRFVSNTLKGTQGAYGVSVQQFKDTGRNITNYYMANQIITTNIDVLMSLTGYKSGAAVATTTTPAVVTAGKTYRINAITMTYVGTTTAGTCHFTLRANTGGVVALASPAVNEWIVGGLNTTAGVTQTVCLSFPDGIEFAAGTGIGVSIQGFGATGTAAAVGYGQISITGYEY